MGAFTRTYAGSARQFPMAQWVRFINIHWRPRGVRGRPTFPEGWAGQASRDHCVLAAPLRGDGTTYGAGSRKKQTARKQKNKILPEWISMNWWTFEAKLIRLYLGNAISCTRQFCKVVW